MSLLPSGISVTIFVLSKAIEKVSQARENGEVSELDRQVALD